MRTPKSRPDEKLSLMQRWDQLVSLAVDGEDRQPWSERFRKAAGQGLDNDQAMAEFVQSELSGFLGFLLDQIDARLNAQTSADDSLRQLVESGMTPASYLYQDVKTITQMADELGQTLDAELQDRTAAVAARIEAQAETLALKAMAHVRGLAATLQSRVKGILPADDRRPAPDRKLAALGSAPRDRIELLHSEPFQGFEIELFQLPEYEEPDWDFESDATRQDVINKIEDGTYMWFTAEVVATYNGIELGREYLGGCCYGSTQEFLDGGYYEDMRAAAVEQATRRLEQMQIPPASSALIEAAPDLLSALLACQAELEAELESDPGAALIVRALEQANAAIAKATA